MSFVNNKYDNYANDSYYTDTSDVLIDFNDE